MLHCHVRGVDTMAALPLFSADRIVMAVSKVMVMLLRCRLLGVLALLMFLSNVLLKSASKSSFFRCGAEIRFWSCNFSCHCVRESFSV